MAQFNLNDFGMSATALSLEYSKTNEHPEYTRQLWDRAAERTTQELPSYWEWVAKQLSEELESLNADLPELGLGLAL